MDKKNNIINNTMMLYGLSIAKIVFPLLTLPYLTRVLTTEAYGVVAYVKSVIQYMQIVVDFGFMLSGTKEIVNCRDDKVAIGKVAGDVLGAKIILVLISGFCLFIMTLFIPLLRSNMTYSFLSFIPVALSIFLFDYIFRGIEKMNVITVRFVIMKGISTALTFMLVKNETDLLLIPILDIIGSAVAVLLVAYEIKKISIKIRISSIKATLNKLAESAVYFASNMATTAFGALNTVLIGIFLSASDVAYWSVCMQMIGAIQTLYNPIFDGIYPEMIKSKDSNLIKKIIKIFTPILIIGCIFCILVAKYALIIVGGEKYAIATNLFRILVPILFFSFYGMLFGWPSLGSIGKQKQVTISTFITAIFQVAGLVFLAFIGQFGLIQIAVLRVVTEFLLMLIRGDYLRKYRTEFSSANGG